MLCSAWAEKPLDNGMLTSEPCSTLGQSEAEMAVTVATKPGSKRVNPRLNGRLPYLLSKLGFSSASLHELAARYTAYGKVNMRLKA